MSSVPRSGSDPANADALAVSAANRSFYEAFESRDLDRMSDVWEHTDRVECVHPGWAPLRGWAKVSASWFALLSGPQHLQFIVTEVAVRVVGDVAWVTCHENLLDGAHTQTVAATNVFVRTSSGWKLSLHHGSPILGRAEVVDGGAGEDGAGH